NAGDSEPADPIENENADEPSNDVSDATTVMTIVETTAATTEQDGSPFAATDVCTEVLKQSCGEASISVFLSNVPDAGLLDRQDRTLLNDSAVHAWNEPYWKALGMQARRREFVGHVNSEVFYENRWHAFDTDMAGLLFRRDGIVAGYDDLQKDATLAESVRSPVPHYPFDWPNDFNTMKRGWQEVAKRTAWYALYNGGFASHPGIVQLRSGESFTRWYDRDHFGGFSKRRFWQNQKGGPFRNWTYFDNGEPFHDKAAANARSEAAYCNGEFIYIPNLQSSRCKEGMSASTANAAHRSASPKLHSSDGQQTSVTFRHFSPYVICGDPVDDANPMSGAATDGLIVEGRGVGDLFCQVSADQGQTWNDVQ
ncbi:MAG: hypothetical protein GY826_18395, partial [Fuerstiella sp.]|nr:hypothetical protein [Fuerstiella sp.]